jgi:aminoglycoside phosphotransferase (APT) family kinase protein
VNIPGIEEPAVSAWLARHVPTAPPPFAFELISGGRSNLTYRVVDRSGAAWALRRPPLGHVLATAHDMGREFRIISGLHGSPVPVAEPVAFCEDVEVNGAPFYVMGFVDGVVVRDIDVGRTLTPAVRRRAGESLVDTLAALHRVVPADVGLEGLGRHEGYLARQVKRWTAQFEGSTSRDLPVIRAVAAVLAERMPPDPPARIVHGDYRLENTVIDRDGAVAAVLDWELCTLGDPLADLGLLLSYWPEAGEDDEISALSPAPLPGFPTRAELADHYAAATGADLAALDYYRAFADWKLACIGEGVANRYHRGAMADAEVVDVEAMWAGVERRAQRAARLLGLPSHHDAAGPAAPPVGQ